MVGAGLNYYTRLGIPSDAEAEEIRQAYFEAARRLHPDANPGRNSEEQFLQVQEAYETLSHPEKRQVYHDALPAEALAPAPVALNILTSRSRLERLSEPQLFYALLELSTSSELDSAQTPPLNTCVVIDRSTSMQGERMEMVKANAHKLLGQMRPQDILSIVSFSDFAEVVVPPMSATELKYIGSKINHLTPGGSTEILRGLELGFEQIYQNLSPARINHLVLLTDGRTYGDEEECLRITELAYHQGIGVSVFGIGEDWNDVFLDRLASVAGGSSAYVALPKDLQRFILEKYAKLEKVFAERISLDFQSDANVELRYAFRIQPEAGLVPTQSPIRLGSLIHANSMMVVLEFLVKPVPPGVRAISLAQGSLKLEIPTRAIPNVRVKFDLRRPVVDQAVHESTPHVILQAISRLSLYRIQDRAREEVRTGEFGPATRHLQQLANHLISHGERDLAKTVLEEAEHIRVHQSYSKEGEKRIKYGTRALLLPPGLEG